MAIRFKCRHCKKTLGVKDHLAGRKAICPACRKPIVIPKPKPSAAEVEDLAASMLGDGEEKKEVKPKVEARPIEFICEFCEEKVQVPLAEAGTKMPCPGCRRIIRVPVPNEDKPKDWRDVHKKGPIGAKDNQPEQLENAWGTEQSRRVTGKALQEADAIPVKVEPVGLGIWLKRGFWGTITAGFLYMAYTGMVHSRGVNQEKAAIDEAVKLAEKLNPDWAAEIHRAAGELYCSQHKPVQAQQHFRKALANLQRSQKTGIDVDLFLIDLALAQIEMGGSEEEVIDKRSFTWTEVQHDVKQTMELISPDYRGLAVRLVGTRLAEKKQASLAIGIAGSSPAQLAGLILAHKAALEKAVQDKDPEVSKSAKKALDGMVNLQVKPAPKSEGPIDPEARQAHVEGLCRQGKYQDALALAGDRRDKDVPEALKCLEACIAGAELALANKNPTEATLFLRKALEEIKEIQEKQGVIPRVLIFEMVRAGIEADVADVDVFAKTLEPACQPCIKLLIFRHKLAKTVTVVTSVEGMDSEQEKRETLSWPLAFEALARHDAHHHAKRADVLAVAGAVQDDRVRAFLLLGFALGQHDSPGRAP